MRKSQEPWSMMAMNIYPTSICWAFTLCQALLDQESVKVSVTDKALTLGRLYSTAGVGEDMGTHKYI